MVQAILDNNIGRRKSIIFFTLASILMLLSSSKGLANPNNPEQESVRATPVLPAQARSFPNKFDWATVEAESVSPTQARSILSSRQLRATASNRGRTKSKAVLIKQASGLVSDENALISSSQALVAGHQAPANAEIIELARALRNDPDLIYQYVHNNISYEALYGQRKGAIGTLLDGSGNSFDQATLMVELLRAAGFSANYVHGLVKIYAAQLNSWLGVDTSSAIPTANLFARGGIPNTVFQVSGSGGILSSAEIDHVWVKVNIDGVDYVFDPSVKSHTYTPKIDWVDVMGYEQTGFLSNALSGSTIANDYIQNLNRTNIRNDLTNYATNLVSHIQSNAESASLADIIGGKRIDSVLDQVRQTELPHQHPQPAIEEWTEIPAQYHALLRIEYLGIDHTFDSKDIYGKRLTIFFNASGQPELRLNGDLIATGNATPIGESHFLTLSVDNPYAGFNGSYWDYTYPDNTQAGASYAIMNSWGKVGQGLLQKHKKWLKEYQYQGEENDTETVLGETLSLIALNWVAERTAVVNLVEKVAQVSVGSHSNFGIVGQHESPFMSIISLQGHTDLQAGTNNALGARLAIGGMASSLEHGVIEQVQPYTAVSTVKMLDIAVANSNKIYRVDSANYSAIQNQLSGYSSGDLTSIESLLTDGSTILLSENGDVSVNQWSGTGYFAYDEPGKLSYRITGGYNGGYGTEIGDAVPETIIEVGEIPITSTEHPASLDPIDMVTGDYFYSHQDISLGSADFPIGLSFEKSYNSASRLHDGSLGLGWSHNFNISARSDSNYRQGLGEDSPIDTVAAIAALTVLADILQGDPLDVPAEQHLTAFVIHRWLMDQLTNNVVFVNIPGNSQQFVKLPDGSFNPPPGVASTLTESAGSYQLIDKDGNEWQFNTDGKLASWSDNNANSMTLSYSAGQLNSVSNNFARTLTLSYDNGRINQVSDGTGRTVNYVYDGVGNLITFTDAESNTTTYEYDLPGRMTKFFTPAFASNPYVISQYDSMDRVKVQTNSLGQSYNYYFAGTRAEEVDPLGNSHVWYYNDYGRTIKEIDANTKITEKNYDGQQRLVQLISPKGNHTDYEYDSLHNRTKVTLHPKTGSSASPIVSLSVSFDPGLNKISQSTDALGNTTHYFYTPNGNLERVESPEPTPGAGTPIVSFTYTGRGQVETQTDAEGQVTHYAYDNTTGDLLTTTRDHGRLNLSTVNTYYDTGDVHTQTDPEGSTSTYTYDNERRLRTITAPAPFHYVTDYLYDKNGNPLEVKKDTDDPEQKQVIKNTYTFSDKLATVTDPENNITHYSYDEIDRKKEITDPEGRTIKYHYDAVGRVHKVQKLKQSQFVTIEEYAYTDNGQKNSVIDANGNQSSYQYDEFDRLQKLIYPDANFAQYAYDDGGNVDFEITRSGIMIDYDYDKLNRRVSKQVGTQAAVTYQYDLRGLQSDVDMGGDNFHYQYDTAGRLLSIRDPKLRTVAYQYYNNDTIQRLTYPDGFFVTYEYDELNRLDKIKQSGTVVLADYTYDALSRRTNLVYGNGTQISYLYEADNDLAFLGHSLNDKNLDYAFTYNKVHQLSAESFSTDVSYFDPSIYTDDYGLANNLNQYPNFNGLPLSYDNNGNLIDDGVNTYDYDNENRLLGVNSDVSYGFDAFGRRASKIVAEVSVEYLYDHNTQVLIEYDEVGNVGRRFVYGPGIDQPILMETGGSQYYYHANRQGSIIALSNANGDMAEQYAYGPFGQSTGISFIGNPYRYTGRRLDEETGLYYYRARNYDVALGRFMQPDPIGYGDGLNIYAYVGNDPLNYYDPYGLGAQESFGEFFLDRLLSGGVRDDLNEAFSVTAVAAGAASLPFIASGNIPAYTALQGVSLVASGGAAITELTPTNIAAFSTDLSSAVITATLAVTNTAFGRTTLLAFETGSSILSYTFFEASANDPEF